MLDQARSSVNEFLIGVPQGLYNAASAVTDPIASLIVGDDAVKQARGQRQRVVDSASRALVSRPSSADRKSVVSGKSVSVRVDLGGRRSITKNTTSYNIPQSHHYLSHKIEKLTNPSHIII